MSPQRERNRRRFALENLEGRVSLSGIGGLDDGVHHHRGGHAAVVSTHRHGADDPATHNVKDDRGGLQVRVHGGDGPAAHNGNDTHGRHHGADDPAGHR